MKSKFFNTRADGKPVLNRTYWNAWYKAERGKLEDKRRSAWGEPTKVMIEEIKKAVGNLRGKKVVILGEGDGRYSVFLVNERARVDHVDYSEGAIIGLKNHVWERHGSSVSIYPITKEISRGVFLIKISELREITAYQMSVSMYGKLPGTKLAAGADLVLSSGLMEYLTPGEVERAIRTWQEGTKVGGAHAIVYLAKGPGVSDIPGEHPHEPGFVESLYPRRKWRFTFQGDTTREDTHIVIRPEDTIITPDRPAETHVHRIMRFVAQKLDD